MLDVNSFVDDNFTGVYYSALVINNNDVDKQGKIQIRISVIHDDVRDSELPWALPASTTNLYDIPLENKQVWVEFQQGNVYEPIYFGYVLSKGSFSGIIAEDYPDTRGILDGKNWITVNRKNGKIEIHNDKSNIKMQSGKITITSTGDLDITVGETKIHNKLTVSNNISATGTITAGGNIQSGANITGAQLHDLSAYTNPALSCGGKIWTILDGIVKLVV